MNQKYAEYLQTDYWKQAAAAVKARAGHRCQLCNSPESLEAHHRTYKYLFKDQDHLDELVCLCRKCHGGYHKKTATSFVPQDEPVRPVRERGRNPRKRRVRAYIEGCASYLARLSYAKGMAVPGHVSFTQFIVDAMKRGWTMERLKKRVHTMTWPAFKSDVACDPFMIDD